MQKKKLSIVVIGGGTGTSVVLEGLKDYPVNLAAIITTADDGSSSGKLRNEFGIIPPGDIRQCLVALASKDFGYLNERFHRGSLAGHTLGNLLITLFSERYKNFQEAIDELLRVTGAQGMLVPATLKPVALVAQLKNGKVLRGESNITSSKEIQKSLRKLYVEPRNVKANPRAVQALKTADSIVVGPGNLYSSILPNFLVEEVRKAFLASYAKKVYIANLFTQPGHTESFSPLDFTRVLAEYIGEDAFSHIIYNSANISEKVFKKHKNTIISAPVKITEETRQDKRCVACPIAKTSPRAKSPSDPIAKIRNLFLHDANKLGRVIMAICK